MVRALRHWFVIRVMLYSPLRMGGSATLHAIGPGALGHLQAADLAEKSAERAVRVASCEFLHASILWMVGTNARRYVHLQEPFQPQGSTNIYRLPRFASIMIYYLIWEESSDTSTCTRRTLS